MGDAPVLSLPPDLTLLSGDLSNPLGNLVLRQVDPPRVLKVYRRRRSKARTWMSLFSGVFVERKRPIDATSRQQIERDCLELWTREGYRTPHVLEGPKPTWIEAPYLWIEDTPGQRLLFALAEPEIPRARKEAWLQQVARETLARQRRALELSEPLLIPEHPTFKHILVHGHDDLVTIDLENAFRPGYPLLYAIAYELASLLRSIPPVPETAGLDEVFLEALDDHDLIRDACRDYSRLTLVRTARRWSDRIRRDRSKTAAVDRLAAHVATSNRSREASGAESLG
ncbi:MAG: hypothetical protein JKY65_04860 [Planctomycetes bacterium]|nr:hypothetical protein [Planctomycetota bacterium]